MKKILFALALSLLLLTQPAVAKDSSTAQMLVGEWRCTQKLEPEEGLTLTVNYIQLFTAQRNFTLDGSMEIEFNMPEMKQMFGGDTLNYLFEGSGSWITQPKRLIIKTENTNMTPNSPLAQQMHDAGIMDMNDLQEMQSEDEFIINSLSKNSLKLTHLEEEFTAECTR